MAGVLHRLRDAMNAKDLDAMVGCFAPDYDSQQPIHPSRAFKGNDQVRENWASIFAAIPNLHVEMLLWTELPDGVEIGEWDWHGTHTDGSSFAMRGVTVVGAADGAIQWARLYMEPVEEEGADIAQSVQETYRPPE